MKIPPLLTLTALLALAFTLATGLASQAENWSRRTKSDNLFGVMLGDGRKLFANHFFTMADVYFHSGYYPSVFDQHSGEQKEIISASHGNKETEEDEKKEDFLGRPKNWVDAFGRNFRITQHTHLEQHNEREILPWLRLAAELDPQKVETYTVGAYFLREHLNRPDQAEAFLREGLHHNPDSSEILLEMGRLYYESHHDLHRARNFWELGLKKFTVLNQKPQQDYKFLHENFLIRLANLEIEAGNYARAIAWFQAAQPLSPNPQVLQKQIEEVQKKLPRASAIAPSSMP